MNKFAQGSVWENDNVSIHIAAQWTEQHPRQIMFEVEIMRFNAEGDIEDFDEGVMTFAELTAFVHEQNMIYREDEYNIDVEIYYDE